MMRVCSVNAGWAHQESHGLNATCGVGTFFEARMFEKE